MSLACLECDRIGSFNTLIIFDEARTFDEDKPISNYPNFYTDCASFDDFQPVKKSRFMIVREKTSQDSWNTGTDGDAIKKTQHKLIDERALKKKLPKIFGSLERWPTRGAR